MSTREVTEDYQKNKEPSFAEATNKSTIVLILIDGLGAAVLSNGIDSAPSIASYFQLKNNEMLTAHAVFPSLTFPNLVSTLSLTTVNNHSIWGNKMILSAKGPQLPLKLDFEKQGDLLWLNDLKETELVFHLLSQKKKSSISFAQSLTSGSTALQRGDAAMAVAYINKSYSTVDQRNIDSLKNFLSSTAPRQWPDFVFIHLIGIDGLSHERGPSDPKVRDYLAELDRSLDPIFKLLQSARNQGFRVSTILTADHGFTDITNVIPIERQIRAELPDVQIINEGRFVSLIAPPDIGPKKMIPMLQKFVFKKGIDVTAYKNSDTLFLFTKHASWKMTLMPEQKCFPYKFSVFINSKQLCPEDIEHELGTFHLPPFAFENLVSYFYAKESPQGLILAGEKTSFHNLYKGHHGGISTEEVFVPLLLQGIRLKRDRTPALFEILKPLFQF